jgi:hypothetical protein
MELIKPMEHLKPSPPRRKITVAAHLNLARADKFLFAVKIITFVGF